MSCAGATTRRSFLSGLLGLALSGCDDDGAEDYRPTYTLKSATPTKSYRFGCPFNTPETLFLVYQPLIDYLNARLDGDTLKLEASRDYDSFEQKLYYRNFDFALANPYQALMAVANGYVIFAKMADDDQYRGLILVRRDSRVETIADLKGQAISYPASSGLAATMLSQAFLHEQGLDVMHEVSNLYVGSEESSILNAYLRKTAAGTTWPLAWNRFQRDEPDKAGQLMIKWETGALPSNALVARDDIPADLVRRIAALLIGMHETEEGRWALDNILLHRFELADAATYEPVKDFLVRFNETVRPVALP
jgi:ABC-type phosphate/phosphonate transport system, periplasmic component